MYSKKDIVFEKINQFFFDVTIVYLREKDWEILTNSFGLLKKHELSVAPHALLFVYENYGRLF